MLMAARSTQLEIEIAVVRDMMLATHYFAESNWMGLAYAAPELCRSGAARESLDRAAAVACQFGYPAVAEWLKHVLPTSPSDPASCSRRSVSREGLEQ
jgi:hypothetical protein